MRPHRRKSSKFSLYPQRMEVGITELVKHVTKLVERAEHGEEIVITRHGRPVAKLTPSERPKQKREFGTLKHQVKLNAGWDEPMPLEMWDVFRHEQVLN